MKKNLYFIALLTLLTGCVPVSNPTTNPDIEPTQPTVTDPSIVPTEPSASEPTEPSITDPSVTDPTIPDPIYPEVSGEEALNHLRTSAYTKEMTTKTDLALSELHNVGVDEDRFNNEIDIYKVPEEGNIFIAEDIGITKDGENNSGIFSIWLENNRNLPGNKIIKFDNGTYPFSSKIDVTGIEDLYIVGSENTEFLFTGFGTYFEAKASKNVQLHNITFDKKYSPTIGGKIVSVSETPDTETVVVSIPEEFDLSQSIYEEPKGGSSYMECRYDKVTGRYVPDNSKFLCYNSPTSANNKGIIGYAYSHSKRELTLVLNKHFPYDNFTRATVGTHISYAYTMYESHGFLFDDCENTVMENITCHVSGGMGLRFDNGKNAYLNNVNFCQKEGSNRVMTCTADIIHGCALEGELIITNCLLESSHDDALNIKSFYTKITSISATSREITVAQTQNEALIKFEKGDTIEVYNPSNYSIVDAYTVQEVVKAGTSYVLTVDKRPRNIEVGYNVGNVTKATHMTLENCLIRNKRNRGILLQGRESTIRNCTFQNVIMGAVQVLSVYDVFREAIMPESIIIENTKFLNCEGGDIYVFTYGSDGVNATQPNCINNVDIRNNFFLNGKGVPVNLLGTGNVNVNNNLFNYDVKNTDHCIGVMASQKVSCKDNLLISSHSINLVYTWSDVTELILDNNIRKETV